MAIDSAEESTSSLKAVLYPGRSCEYEVAEKKNNNKREK